MDMVAHQTIGIDGAMGSGDRYPISQISILREGLVRPHQKRVERVERGSSLKGQGTGT